jgi:hypothetical protein
VNAGGAIVAAAVALAASAAVAQDAPPGAPPVEDRFPELRDRITRSKARPGSLADRVGPRDARAPRAIVLHRNEMGSGFHLESVSYALDGATVYAKLDVDGDLAAEREFAVFDGIVTPGAHVVTVQLVYRGVGGGLDRFHEGFRFQVQSTHPFGAAPDQVVTLRVTGYERDAPDMADRPAVRFRAEAAGDVAGAPEPAPAARAR